MSKRLKSASSARSAAARGTSARTVKSIGSKKSGSGSKVVADTDTYQCVPCRVEGSILEATNFCMDCGENLCEQCVNTHKKFPAMKNHQILGKSARKSETDTIVTVNPLECPDHPGRIVDMYCEQHDDIWCGACIAVNHKVCTSTRQIADAAKGIADSEEYKEIKIRITAAKAEVVAMKKEASTTVTALVKEKERAAARIKDFRKKINTILDKMEQDTEQELESEYGRCLKQLEHDLNVYNNTINSFDAFTSMLQTRKTDTAEKPSIIFVGIQRAKQKIKFVNEIAKLTKLIDKDSYFQFFPDERITSWLSSLKLLGMFSHQQRPYKSTSSQTYNVSHSSDKRSCDIYGSCLLDNGGILLTDWDNSKVKRLDEKYSLTDICEVPGNPANICCINPQEAVVTLTPQQTLQFIRLDKVMTLSRKLVVGEKCRGVACNNGYIYVVCGGFKNETVGNIKIYTVAGSLIKAVENNNSNQRIFSSPIALAVSSDGRFCHVTDGQRGIITITQRNDVVSVVCQRNVAWPCGISLDSHDNVLACCSKSQTVVQKFGVHSLDTILTYENGVRRPSSICFDRKHMRLLVTSNMANVIRVFQLESGPITGVPPQTSPEVEVPDKGKKKPGQTRVKTASPMKKDTKAPLQSQPTVKPETATKAASTTKRGVKLPPFSARSKTEMKPSDDKGVTWKSDAKAKDVEAKPAVENDTKTNYRKDPLGSSDKKSNDTKENNESNDKNNEVLSEIANDITKLLTSDNAEKTADDFKITLKKIMDANIAMKKSK